MIKKITPWFILGAVLVIAIYDIIAVTFGSNATISEAIWNWSSKFPIVPFLAGLLTGHLFFNENNG